MSTVERTSVRASHGEAGASRAAVTPEQVAMLCIGTERYGIGTIEKLYAQGAPGMSFVCTREGHMLEWLRENGHRVDLVPGLGAFWAQGSLRTLLRMPGVIRQARGDAKRLDALLRPRGVTVVHAQWMAQQLVAGWMRRLGYRSVWQINNNMNPRRLMGLGVKLNHRFAHWGADVLLPASDYIARNWQGCGVPMRTVRNAAVPRFQAPNQLPPTPVRCVVAGRLEASKGHHLAVEAVLKARAQGLDVRLDSFGGPLEENAYAAALVERIRSAGAEQAIRIRGFDADLRQKHQEYHLALQCRVDPEPCSLWVCETMVDGLPIVAADNGGTPELVKHGESGLLFRSGDAEDLAARIIELARDPSRLAAMRQAAFERGQRHFTLQRFIRETFEAYGGAV